MIRTLRSIVSFVVAAQALVGVSYSRASAAEDRIDFNRQIRPLLSDNCFQCHGPDAKAREADLRLDLEASAKAGRDGHVVIAPGKPSDSALVIRITSQNPEERMPPHSSDKHLTDAEIELLTAWIKQGANWSTHWAYVPPQRHAIPMVNNTSWPINWIDHFLLAKLEAAGLQPSPDADRITLIRRLSFDLTGLPPTPDEGDRFVNDQAADAFEKVVDRLLASDRYGERMAMYWLDLVRYADTVGYHGDQDHNISPYRDYVIDAFNDNLPFDQFTREQLAGDLLPGSTIDQKIASAYNRLLQTSHEGGVQPKEYLAMYAADRVRNLSGVWMGATMGCSQCHDHKYDPYTTKDFYSMVAFFADLDEAQHLTKASNTLPTSRPPEISVLTKRERQRIETLEKAIQNWESEQQQPSANGTSQESELEQNVVSVKQEIEAIRNAARKTMISVTIEPRTIRILPRGNWLDDSGEIVQPAVPEFLGRVENGGQRASRLNLANWLTDAKHGSGGLTARVFANRFWYLLFGGGFAGVLDDFGGQGEPPSHPQLLDNLAVEFIANGWNVKQTVKLIVMSRAYRQTSLVSPELREHDSDNLLWARQSRFRLPAEMIRDNVLAISGLLQLDYGGGSVRPYQPPGYYRHLNFPKRSYAHDTDARQWRRGVYVHWQRQFLHPMFKAFDAPRREECTAQRPRSNTPSGALVMLNDPTFVEAARVFAERILREGGPEDDQRFDHALRLAVSRKPASSERQVLKQFLTRMRRQYQSDPASAKAIATIGQAAPAADLNAVEVATWTAVARVLLNMSETITRN